jgi:hypothetical protein
MKHACSSTTKVGQHMLAAYGVKGQQSGSSSRRQGQQVAEEEEQKEV